MDFSFLEFLSEVDFFSLMVCFLLIGFFLVWETYRDREFRRTIQTLEKKQDEIKSQVHYYQNELFKVHLTLKDTQEHLKRIEIRLFSWKGKMTF